MLRILSDIIDKNIQNYMRNAGLFNIKKYVYFSIFNSLTSRAPIAQIALIRPL